jgi:hypothetical protein
MKTVCQNQNTAIIFPLQNFTSHFPSKVPPLYIPLLAPPISSPPLPPPPLSLTLSLAMAVLFQSQYDNKENVPPFFPKQDALLVAKSKSPLPTSNQRRVRRPLEDITNLLNQEILLRSVLDDRIRILHSLPSASRLKCGKRRAEDGADPSCKKTQLPHPSKNFR